MRRWTRAVLASTSFIVVACLIVAYLVWSPKGKREQVVASEQPNSLSVGQQQAVDAYMNLLEATYKQDNTRLSQYSGNEKSNAEQQVGSVREAYTDNGMVITDVKVTSTIQSVEQSENSDVMTALVHTDIAFTLPTGGESENTEHSTWDDVHIFTLTKSSVARDLNSAPNVSEDRIVPESSL